MPSATAFSTAGPMALASCARMISALAPCEIRLSTSVSCLAAEDWASAEIYLSPEASSAALIAASSVFQRSSWKLDQETPMILSFACATPASDTDSATPASKAAANIFMISSLRPLQGAMTMAWGPCRGYYFEPRKNSVVTLKFCQHPAEG